MNTFCAALLATVSSTLLATLPVLADDWTATQLRGQVLQLVDNQWQPLQRGAVVPDSRVIRTLGSGHVVFNRGLETLDLGPNTQVQIHDQGTAAKPNTMVRQYFGTVSVEAQVENVQHFAVETPYLAAVVKGTRFTVTSGKTGAEVSVQRGHVEVEDHHDKSHTLITVGQSATVDTAITDDALSVSGSGLLPVVIGANGKPLPPAPKGKAPKPPGKGKSSSDDVAAIGPKGPEVHGKGDGGPAGDKGKPDGGHGNAGDNGNAGKSGPGSGGPGGGGADNSNGKGNGGPSGKPGPGGNGKGNGKD